MKIEQVLKEAEAYMLKIKTADWRIYEYFKKKVGWIEPSRYEVFIKKLTKILRLG